MALVQNFASAFRCLSKIKFRCNEEELVNVDVQSGSTAYCSMSKLRISIGSKCAVKIEYTYTSIKCDQGEKSCFSSA